MKFLGIDFVPLKISFHRRVETFWAGFWFISFAFGLMIFTPPFLYLCFTQFWWVSVLMALWIYLDRETCKKGGRPMDWMLNWACWSYLTIYYRSELFCDEEFKLDPNRNYLFCAFPHGILPKGLFSNVLNKKSPFQTLYPKVDVKIATLNMNFFIPIMREVWLGLKFISCSFESLHYVLTKPSGGTVVTLAIGGAEEAILSKPRTYKVIIKNRKGFVRLALSTGAPLVPVITFGDNDMFDQIDNPVLRRFQQFVKRCFGFSPIIFNGRGMFQYSFGLIPRRTKMTTVFSVGKPIDVEKVENPSQQEVDKIHEKFVDELEKLFEKFKHKQVENPEHVHLELY